MDDQSQPKTFHYFADGSNMMTARLLGRCPSAKVVSLAHADGYKLAFSKLSVDTSGKATLIPFAGQRPAASCSRSISKSARHSISSRATSISGMMPFR